MATFPGAVSTDSDLYIAVNNKTTQLTDNPLTIGATTANVVSTAGFPTVGFISIDGEIIKYSGLTGTSFTGLTRGQDGTSAAAHVQNSQVYHNVIAIHHNVLKDEIKAEQLFISQTIGLTVNRVIAQSAGSAAAPYFTWIGDLDTGIYYRTSNAFALAANGVSKLDISAAGISAQDTLFSDIKILQGSGTASVPAYGFQSDNLTGIYLAGTNQLGITVGGTLRARFVTSGLNIDSGSLFINGAGGVIQTQDGAAANPSFSFANDPDTGLFTAGGNSVRVAAGGVEVLKMYRTDATNLGIQMIAANATIENNLGSTARPSYSFGGDNDTGMTSGGANNLDLITGGTLMLRCETPTNGVSIIGVSSGVNAAAGFVGQYIESVVSNILYPASGSYGDITSIALTAGDWDVTALLEFDPTTATAIQSTLVGVSATSGNSGSGLTGGGNRAYFNPTAAGSGNLASASVPNFRVSISGSATYYLKVFATYGTAGPRANARLSARRVR